ncbi:extracellular solute-binding protein [Photobacterium carnosum]|uniref:ABC transporter substrate-binding protein n=1 Tax=Photobacterium carnosum TaxID=2023717 RepID=UPI001E28508E|nr:extracellular solute-binding protein [Photobacterium carnosum]MCD9522952.1 extracellular solute-binding protein [Photobacterium carnosum]
MKKLILASVVGLSCLSQSVLAKDITVWAWDPNFNIAIMQEAADVYKSKHSDVNINVVEFSKTEIEQKLHTMLASGVTSALPDVVLIEDYNVQKYLQSYPGSFYEMTNDIDYSQFAPYKRSIVTFDDKVYGLPFDTGVTGLFYRTDILAKAGFTHTDLNNITWDRFIEIGQQVKEKTGISLLGANPSNDFQLIRLMVHSGGSWYFNKDGTFNIKNNKVVQESVRIFRDLNLAGIVRPTIGWSEWVGSINNGSVASVITGVWIIPSIKAGKDQEGKWALAPTPRLNIDGAVNYSNLGGSSWFVLSASKEKQTAIDFLNTTFASDKEFYNTILTNQGAVGSYLPAGNTDAYQTEDVHFNGQRIYSEFNEWIAKIPAIDYGMYTYEVDAAIAAQMPSIMKGLPIEEALERVEQQLKYQIQ